MAEVKAITLARLRKIVARAELHRRPAGGGTAMTIKIERVETRAELYEESGYNRGQPQAKIPALTDDAANELLEEIEPLAERAVAGYECRWDGSNNKGHLSEDAQEASDEIWGLISGRQFDENDCVHAWAIGDWLAETSDEELARDFGLRPGCDLAAVAEAVSKEALSHSEVDALTGNVERHLQSRLDAQGEGSV